MAGTRKLSDEEIGDRITSLRKWTLENGQLCRELKFEDFTRAFGFMASVATVAQAMDHHPDWSNVYQTVRIRLSSHDVGGISDRDFVLARRIDELANGHVLAG